MSNSFRIEYNARSGVWMIHRYNKAVGFWTYVHSEPTKALAVQWAERASH